MLAIKSGADLFDANRCARQVNNEFDQADCPELSRPGPFSVCSGMVAQLSRGALPNDQTLSNKRVPWALASHLPCDGEWQAIRIRRWAGRTLRSL